jgi:hypothetical protein
MAFDQKTRNLLQRTVTACRRALDREFTAQLQELYGIQPDGTITPCAALDHLGDEELEVARLLRERVNHLEGGVATETFARTTAKPAHIARVIREQAFTVLNRLAALRLCEERGLVLECVRKGTNSEGFQLFMSSAGNALGETNAAYHVYLECLFDELSLDLGVLFDRFSPLALMFPRHDALMEVLRELNGTGKAAEREEMPPEQFAQIWQADETIGWIYQYYNDEAERSQMREESSAPQNSRELAVRNQFFTPRYVVQFLTDNTLGRIWYEMTRGETKLGEQCRYLVRRPNEIFLSDPRQVYDRILGKPQDSEYAFNETVLAAYNGDVSKLPDDAGPNSRLIGAAIPPDQFQKITGQASQPMENDRLGKVIQSIVDGSPNQDSESQSVLWAAISQFTLNDGGGAYSIKPWQKLWAKFISVASRPAPVDNLSQADLLKQPVFVPHRPVKDPRTILLLDPACGSMHFGLYAFDLLDVIYDEAWELEEKCGVDALMRPIELKSLHDAYATKDDFLKDVPRLIIEHNIHGIDIDPRAAQIAGLALWLRAQKAWKAMDIMPVERPRIQRSNIVCAEPMPGEKEMLREFVEREFPAAERGIFLQLLDAIFDKMQLAGEAGSLLKIEEEIRDAVAEAKALWEETPKVKQTVLFPEPSLLEQKEIKLDASVITDEQFWESAEERIYAALREYSEHAESGGGFQRRLFADDAARGFAFIDVCRKRYDVAVMNPPFGESPKSVYLQTAEDDVGSTREIASLFLSRGLQFLKPLGRLGVIATRMLFFLDQLDVWREQMFLSYHLNLVADFGIGVLDAVVDTAAMVFAPGQSGTGIFYRLLSATDKETGLRVGIGDPKLNRDVFLVDNRFDRVPGHRVAYWASSRLLDLFRSDPLGDFALVSKGLETGNDERFLRLHVEVPISLLGQRWCRYAKGGGYQPFAGNHDLVVDFKLFPFARRTTDSTYYGKAGITYTQRTTSYLSFRALPEGNIFSPGGPAIIPKNTEHLNLLISMLSCRPLGVLVELCVGSGDSAVRGGSARNYTTGILKALPYLIERLDNLGTLAVSKAVQQRFQCVYQHQLAVDELSPYYVTTYRLSPGDTIRSIALNAADGFIKDAVEVLASDAEVDSIWRRVFGFAEEDSNMLDLDFARHPAHCSGGTIPTSFSDIKDVSQSSDEESASESGGGNRQLVKRSHIIHPELESAALRFGCSPRDLENCSQFKEAVVEGGRLACESIISSLIGIIFGRWDILYSTGEKTAPESPDPFIPLPKCPPGQLQSEHGLAAQSKDIPANYPVQIPWDGILADDPNSLFDIELRISIAVQIIWKNRSDAIEHETCEILKVNSLREYFRRPAGFFADHLKRYSKSRRQAPIYWPLSTSSGSYTLWVYYHRLDDQTLYKCLQQFVDPKLADVEKERTKLRTVMASDEGSSKDRNELEVLEDFHRELTELRTELEYWAPKWKPNLNDGVLITACPLWKLFRLPKWQKDLKACWKELEKGDYDWAHQAHSLWPDRVREKCKTDRSLAIAHGLEDLCTVKAPEKKVKKPKKTKAKSTAELDLEPDATKAAKS